VAFERFKPAVASDEVSFRVYDDGMKKTDFLDALG